LGLSGGRFAFFLLVIFVIVVLVLAGADTKAFFADLAVFLWRFLLATLAAVIFCSFGSKNAEVLVFFE
jgi:hypothetical protein